MPKEVAVVLTSSLSPDKIVLLALIAAYCAGILSKKTHRPLLATIVRYIEGPSVHDSEMQAVSIPTLEEILRSIREACIKADLANGSEHADDIELRVLHALWTIQSLDSLHTFITRAKTLLVKNLDEGTTMMKNMPQNAIPAFLLTRSSFLGRFVEASVNDFESLSFDKADLLWKSFVSFRDANKAIWAHIPKGKSDFAPVDISGTSGEGDDPTLIKSLLDKLQPAGSYASKETHLVSQDDLARLVDYQVHIFEAYGTPTHPELRKILTHMSQSEMGKIPSTHYISYLECLRRVDFEGAFNSLHRYFDYMMSNKHTVFYHYALLSLASLYAAFNCEGEALRAIEESISVARENKDMTCLNFLLTWVFNFLKDRPKLKHQFYVSNDQLLQFLKSRAGESSSSLHSTAYQSDATQLMLEGSSLSSVLESLVKAIYISVNSDSKSLAFISCCSLASSFWLRTGNYELAEVYTSISLDSSTFMSQKVDVMIRKAHLELTVGNIENAFKILDEQKAVVPDDVRLLKNLVGHRLLLQARQSIRLSRYNLAGMYLSKLQAQQHVNVDVEGAQFFLQAELQMKLGNFPKAYQIVTDKTNDYSRESANKYWLILFSILKCKIITQSSAPSRALSMSIHCLNTAASSGYIHLALHATIQVVDVLICLEQYHDARELLVETLPKFETACDLELKSLAYQQQAHVLIKLYKEGAYPEQDKVDIITKIVQCLEISIDGLKKLSYFEEIKKSLELQLEIGTHIFHQEIITHAEASLKKIKLKIEEEITATY